MLLLLRTQRRSLFDVLSQQGNPGDVKVCTYEVSHWNYAADQRTIGILLLPIRWLAGLSGLVMSG